MPHAACCCNAFPRSCSSMTSDPHPRGAAGPQTLITLCSTSRMVSECRPSHSWPSPESKSEDDVPSSSTPPSNGMKATCARAHASRQPSPASRMVKPYHRHPALVSTLASAGRWTPPPSNLPQAVESREVSSRHVTRGHVHEHYRAAAVENRAHCIVFALD